jgi:pimeloyl-ACP methyl ester carboxylesterase
VDGCCGRSKGSDTLTRDEWIRGGHFADAGEGLRVFWRADGAGPALLFAHGFPTSSHDWAPVVARLQDRFRCVCFDLLGFGASSKPRRDYTYALQHRAMAAAVRAAGVQRGVLVAHDYSVTMAQHLLGKLAPAPLVLEKVALLNGGLDPAVHRPRPLQRLLSTRLGALLGPRLLSKRSVLKALREVFARPEALDGEAAWEAISSDGGLQAMPRLLAYMAERRDSREALLRALREAPVPVGFCWGQRDPVSGAHVLAAVRDLPPRAEVLALEGIGHYPQLEAPDEVAAFLARFGAGGG